MVLESGWVDRIGRVDPIHDQPYLVVTQRELQWLNFHPALQHHNKGNCYLAQKNRLTCTTRREARLSEILALRDWLDGGIHMSTPHVILLGIFKCELVSYQLGQMKKI